MKGCCENQTTPFCGTCGADLEAKSLTGLKTHLQGRLQSANKRLNGWLAKSEAHKGDKEKVKQGIARSTDAIIQLDSWIVEIAKEIRNETTTG